MNQVLTVVYSRPRRTLFGEETEYDFMTFKYPRQLIKFLKNMGNFKIINIQMTKWNFK